MPEFVMSRYVFSLALPQFVGIEMSARAPETLSIFQHRTETIPFITPG